MLKLLKLLLHWCISETGHPPVSTGEAGAQAVKQGRDKKKIILGLS